MADENRSTVSRSQDAAGELEMNRAMDTQMDTWPANTFSVFPVRVLTC